MDVLTIIQTITFLDVVKFLIVLLLLVYAVFALLMMRQVAAMTRAVAMKDDFVIRLLGVAHFAFALVVLVVALVFL